MDFFIQYNRYAIESWYSGGGVARSAGSNSIEDSFHRVAWPEISFNNIVATFVRPEKKQMNEFKEKLRELFGRIPRRHNADNVKELYSILDAYEDLLMKMETDEYYEKQIARFFDVLEPIRATIKKSNDNKASKKTKDVLFDEASGAVKDTMEELMQL